MYNLLLYYPRYLNFLFTVNLYTGERSSKIIVINENKLLKVKLYHFVS